MYLILKEIVKINKDIVRAPYKLFNLKSPFKSVGFYFNFSFNETY